jgi:hypothetical protein
MVLLEDSDMLEELRKLGVEVEARMYCRTRGISFGKLVSTDIGVLERDQEMTLKLFLAIKEMKKDYYKKQEMEFKQYLRDRFISEACTHASVTHEFID